MDVLDDTLTTASSVAHGVSSMLAATASDAHDGITGLTDATRSGAAMIADQTSGVGSSRSGAAARWAVPAAIAAIVIAILVARSTRDDDGASGAGGSS